MPQPNPELLRERLVADLDNDLLNWKKAGAQWQDDFIKTRGGAQAFDAVNEARAFHEKRFRPLRQKYAADPAASAWLRAEGSAIVNRSLGYMNEVSRRETESYLETTLAEEERELRRLAVSNDTLDEIKQEAFHGYMAKAEAWRARRGDSPEEIAGWRGEFEKSVSAELLKSRFEEALDRDPGEALALAGEEEQGPAADFSRVFSSEELGVMQSRAQAASLERRRLNEALVGEIVSGIPAGFSRALDSGDFGQIESMEKKLAELGRKDKAEEVTAARRELANIQPFFQRSHYASFAEQRERLNGVRTMEIRPENEGRPGGLAALELRWEDCLENTIREREKAYRKDPAGFVSGHSLLGREGLSREQFMQEEGLNLEGYFNRSLKIQTDIGKGTGMSPRLLSNEHAAEIRDGYEDQPDVRSKARYLKQLTAESGGYAARTLAEAGFPAGLAGLSGILPDLSASETGKLIEAAGTRLEDWPLSDERKVEIRQEVEDMPFMQALRQVDALLGPDDSKPGPVLQQIRQTLESHAAAGGNLPDLERRITLHDQIMSAQLEEASARANRSVGELGAWDEFWRGFGLTVGAINDGFVGFLDFAATPARAGLNAVNEAAGGTPDYFKPVAPQIKELAGLPEPETPLEKTFYEPVKASAEGGPILLAAKVRLAYESVARGGEMLGSSLSKLLAANPETQMVDNAISGAAGLAAQNAGLGPVGQVVAEVVSGVRGGKNLLSNGSANIHTSKNISLPHTDSADTKASGKLLFDSKKWDYLFGRVESSIENKARSKQLKNVMDDLGIDEDNFYHKKMLYEYFEEISRIGKIIRSKEGFDNTVNITRESFFKGPSGKTYKFENVYQIQKNGTLKYITTIPKALKK